MSFHARLSQKARLEHKKNYTKLKAHSMDPLALPEVGMQVPWTYCGEYRVGAIDDNAGMVRVLFYKVRGKGEGAPIYWLVIIPPDEYEQAMATLLMGLLIDVIPNPGWYGCRRN